MEVPVKAISIRQPWAWAIINAGKDVENRSWETRLRGTVAIHAARTPDVSGFFNFIKRQNLVLPISLDVDAANELPKGAIIGLVDIINCITTASSSAWWEGPKGFVLSNPRALVPIPCKGAMQFFDLPTEVVLGIQQQLAASSF
jgi:hypothetical protein